jgi:hypothetical protein
MQTFEDLIDRIKRDRLRKDLKLVAYGEFPYTLIDERDLDKLIAAAGPRDQEIERLRTRLSALEAAVDEVIRIADSGGGKLPHVIWAAIDRLRAALGNQ